MNDTPLLIVDGAVEQSLRLSVNELKALPDAYQVQDVSRFHPKRQGDGVELEAVRAEGIVVYHRGGEPLTPDQGGPIRFLIRDPAACHTDELDDCANVKYLSRIELTVRRGRDTRPTTDDEHARLHQANGGD